MVKNIISYILSFIMVALIIAIVAVSFLQNKVLNEDYWKMQMEQNNYYEKQTISTYPISMSLLPFCSVME